MKKTNLQRRIRRHSRLRKKVVGTRECPRLAVFRSNQHIYAQIIDDQAGKTLASASDWKLGKVSKSEKASAVGKSLAEKAVKLGIKSVVYDRGGFLYHGRIARLAQAAREGGLKF